MEFKLLLNGVFDGLIQIYSNVSIGGVEVDFFLPEWNIVIIDVDRLSQNNQELIRNKILEYGGDDYPVAFFYIGADNDLNVINSILRIASCDLYWCPNGYVDHREWISVLGEQ